MLNVNLILLNELEVGINSVFSAVLIQYHGLMQYLQGPGPTFLDNICPFSESGILL